MSSTAFFRGIRTFQTTHSRCGWRLGSARVIPRAPPRVNLQLSGLRFESTTGNAKASTRTATNTRPPSQKPAYPEKLCVYHAGTGRITFLSCLKYSTLCIFIFFGFIVTPPYFKKEGPSLTVLRTTLAAIVPLIFVAYTTSPFVPFVHIKLPPFARQSEEMLRRYIRTLPPQTELDMTTMSFIARPRISRVKLNELQPTNKKLGIVNYARDTTAENAARKWYQLPAVGNFSLQSNRMPRVSWVWDEIANRIAKERA
ncbi:hypothetical protein F4778DRAFT_750973 [Xylariomycetidae sp. FL2044]|nr:hypothetical protein F4778DRAFT_750973 [Xylariomycetidae sp. FL2044]